MQDLGTEKAPKIVQKVCRVFEMGSRTKSRTPVYPLPMAPFQLATKTDPRVFEMGSRTKSRTHIYTLPMAPPKRTPSTKTPLPPKRDSFDVMKLLAEWICFLICAYLSLFVQVLGAEKAPKNIQKVCRVFVWKVRALQGGRFGRFRVEGSVCIVFYLLGAPGCKVRTLFCVCLGGSDFAGWEVRTLQDFCLDGSDSAGWMVRTLQCLICLGPPPKHLLTKTPPPPNTTSTKKNTPSTNKAPLPPKCHLTILMRCHGFGFLGHDLYKLICSRALARLFVLI